jgi:eukaryotic-like serine/threonine-protein kinase
VKLQAAHGDPARFVREARAAASLSHENIAGVYDFGEEDGVQYLVLEHLTGGSLEERLPPGRPLADAKVRRIASELAAGLAHAHTRGVVHRDLKPSNVLFDGEGRAKLADFGIAHARGEATLTEAGTILGTAAYLSPEQASGEPTGPPTDVYSFGVILFRMLTGRLPFQGDQPLELALKHRDEPPPPLGDVRPDAPFELAALADVALAKSPSARPPDGAALTAILAGDETVVLAPPDTQATVVLSPVRANAADRRRRRLLPFLAALLVLAGGGVALAVLLAANEGGSPRTTAPTAAHRTTVETSVPSASVETATPSTAPTTTQSRSTLQTTTAPPPTQPTTTAPPPTTAPVSTGTTVTATG